MFIYLKKIFPKSEIIDIFNCKMDLNREGLSGCSFCLMDSTCNSIENELAELKSITASELEDKLSKYL